MLSSQRLTLFALLTLTAGLVRATPSKITWTKGAGTPDFVTPGNWESGNVTLSTLPDDTTSAISQFSGPADQASNVATAHSAAGIEITADAGNVTLTGNATLTLGDSGIVDSAAGGKQTVSAPLDFTGNSSLITSAGNLEISGPVTNATAQGLHLAGTSNSSKISGAISGSADLIKDDTGTWKLDAANSYTGKTIVNNGTLQLDVAGALPSGKDVTVAAHGGPSAKLDLNATSQQVGAVTLGGDATSSSTITLGGGTLSLGGTLTYDASNNPATANISGGTIDLGGSRSFNVGASANSSNGDLMISSAITGNGDGLIKDGGGRLVLAGNNSYTGTTIVHNGRLQLATGATHPTGGAVTVDAQNTGGSATFDLGSTSQTIGTLTLRGASNSSNNVDLGPVGVLTLGGDVVYDAGNAPAGATISNGTAVQLSASSHTFDVGHSSNATMGDLTVMTPIGGTADLTKTGGGTLVFTADNTYSGTTVVNGGVLALGNGGTAGLVAGDINNSSQVIFNHSNAVTYGHVLSGNGTLLQNGSGTLTLAGANTFTGGITVNGGKLAISSDANLGAVPAEPTYDLVVLNGGTLEVTTDTTVAANRGIGLSGAVAGIQVDGTAKLAYGGTIDGTATLDKTGTGTLELSGTNSYGGQTQVHAGTLKDTAGHSFSSSSNLAIASGATVAVNGDETVEGLSDLGGAGGALALANGAKLTLNGGGTFSGAVTGNGSLELSSNYINETLTGTNTYTGGTKIGYGARLQIGNGTSGVGGTSGAILSGNITNNGALVFDRSDAIQYGGISGNGIVTHIGAGTLTLNNSNTYTGGTFVSGGNLTDAAQNALPATGGVYLSRGLLNIQHNEVIGGLGDWTSADTYAPGNVTITTGATLTLAGSGNEFSGSISGAGGLVLAKGAYETVTGNVTHTGGTVIGYGGNLQIGQGTAAGAVSGTIVDNGALMFNRSDSITYGGLTGAGRVVQQGSGTLTLSGVNTYSGDTDVYSGTLTDANPNAFSPNSIIRLQGDHITLNMTANEVIAGLGAYYYYGNQTLNLNGALTINGVGDSFQGSVTGNGSLKIGAGTNQTFSGALGHTGGTTIAPGGILTIGNGPTTASIASNITDNGTFVFDRSDTLAYAGVLSGTGSLVVGDTGGTLALSGANTYSGPTHVGYGTLRVDATNALPTATAVNFQNDGTLDIEAEQTIGQLTGDYGYVTLGNGHILTIAPGGANRPSTFGGSLSGTGALVLNAPGSSLSLTDSSTYAGGTTVNGGSVLVGTNGALGSGGVTLNSGAGLLIGSSDASDVTLSNAVDLTNGVTLGGGTRDYGLELAGQVSVHGGMATVHIDNAVKLSGGLKAATGTSAVTFDSAPGGFGRAILLGNHAIDPSITDITAINAGVIFGDQAAVPASGLNLGTNNGYIGIGNMGDSSYVTPTAASVLNLIANKPTFAGAIGFDTLTRSGAPHTFADNIDLSGFGAGTTIGSTTQAVLTGTVTPGANGYMFGNGGGALFVQSALTGGNVTVSSAPSVPGNTLITIFEGNNSFTGGLSVTNSLALLDSGTALPNGRTVTLGNNGYVGFTEAFTPATSLGSFIAHQLAPGGYTATSVIGIDSHQTAVDTLAHGHASDTRFVSDTIDLSGLNSVYLGTATGLYLSGRIIAPNQGGANKALSLLAADGSTLTISSSLTPDNVSSVVVGSGAPFANGTVALLGTSTYAGGTTLRSGTLRLQRSTVKANGSIVAGPLGTGTLTVSPVGQKEPVLTGSSALTLDNAITLGGPLTLGTSAFSYSNLVLNGVIGEVGGTHGSLDIAGETTLNGANTFTGGVNLSSGYLALGNDQALGSGTLTISGDNSDAETYLATVPQTGARTLANPIVVTGNGTQYLYLNGNFTLNGSLTLNSPTTLGLQDNGTATLNGPILGSAPLTTEYGTIVLNPSSPTTATGGITSEDGVLILANPNAIPANPVTNALTAYYGGYIGVGFVPGNLQSDFLNRFNKVDTDGTIGFDSASLATPNTFNSPINLTGFNGGPRLGSATSAILGAGAMITPPDTTYYFGGGGGTLRVDSALTDDPSGSSRDLSIDSTETAPLTLRLTGANTYTGGTQLSYSGVIFAANALPATGTIDVDYGYVGTEDPAFASNPNSFISHFGTSGWHTIIGFDSPNGSAVAVSGNVSLAGFSDANAYIGTATSAVISGDITLATGESSYHFAGFKGGQLTVASTLSGSAGVVIGDDFNPGTFSNASVPGSPLSRVTLTGANTYTGSTTLAAGELFVGNANALGTGSLNLDGESHSPDGRHLGLSASASGITLANAIAIGSVDLDVGAGDASFGLSGAITSSASGGLYKIGAGTVTLSGNNSVFAGNVVVQGGNLVFAPAASGNSFGSGGLTFDSVSASNVTFQDNAVVNGIQDLRGTGTITLTAGKTFGINQTQNGEFDGSIAGTTAGLTLAGSGNQLRLGGTNTYVGATTVQSGFAVVAASSTAFGNVANAVTLNGGKIVVEPGVTISNPLTVVSGKLAGTGTIAASGITIGTGTLVSPGETNVVGTLHFANSLTFGGGGTLQLRLADVGATSSGWDQVQVNGNLAITAAPGTPFTVQVVPFTAGGLLTSGLPANFNPSAAGSWMIASANSITGFNANEFILDTTAFSGSLMGGTFSLAMNGANTGLMLNFTPVPEPSTYALMLAGAGAVFFVSRRRRRRG